MRPSPQLPALTALAVLCSCAIESSLRPGDVLAAGSALLSDTGTAPAGVLEVEAFGRLEDGEAVSTPVTLNYGVTDSIEVFAVPVPYLVAARPGPDARGLGDLALGVTHRFSGVASEGTSAAVQAGAVLPTGDEDEGLGTGETDLFALVVGSRWTGRFLVSATAQLDLLGDPDGGGPDAGLAGSLDAFLVLDERAGVLWQLAASRVPETDEDAASLTVGGVLALGESVTLDVGVAWGLGGSAPDAQVLAGLVFSFATR